jgi:integrase
MWHQMHLSCIWFASGRKTSVKLTAAAIRNHRAEEENASDDDLKNGYVRFRATGAHAYYVCHGTPRKWRKVGDLAGPGALTLDQARTAAMELLTKLAHGHDPAIDKAKARVAAQNTFGALIEPYLARQRQGRRENTVREVVRYLTVHAEPLHRLPVKEIDRATIAGLLAAIETERGPGARNNLRNYLSSLFGWMQGEGHIDANVVLATNKAAHKSRDRLLTDDEARVILTALDGPQRVDVDFRDIVKLLFLTGLRRNEVAALMWAEVDFDRATIVIATERMKNHREHVVPQCAAATTILRERHARLDSGDPRTTVFGRRDSGFSGFSKSKRELDAAITWANGGKPIDWVLHDIRRFVSTTLHERLGAEPHIVEAILAHYAQGVSGIYNRSAYAIEKRRALDKLADHLEALRSGKTAGVKVVSLGNRAR